jgi:hypothetical protein
MNLLLGAFPLFIFVLFAGFIGAGLNDPRH